MPNTRSCSITCIQQIRTERLTHPWRFGSLFQVDAAAGGVSQHLLVHGLLCPSLLRVFFHQLGKLRVDGLYQGDKTKETSALLLCANPGLNYLWWKYSQGLTKVLCKSFGLAFQRGNPAGSLFWGINYVCAKNKHALQHLWFSLHMSTIFQDMGVAFVPDFSHSLASKAEKWLRKPTVSDTNKNVWIL